MKITMIGIFMSLTIKKIENFKKKKIKNQYFLSKLLV